MLGDFILEALTSAPGTGVINLPSVAPSGRLTWVSKYGANPAPVLYVMDNTASLQEWGFGTFQPGSPAVITRDTVIGNSAGTTARLNFNAAGVRVYCAWPSVSQLGMLAENVGRNFIHNSMFRVQQRGAGAFTGNNVYSADRWVQQQVTSTLSTSIIALADADKAAIGDDQARYALQMVCGGTAGAGDYALMSQRIENTRRLGNKTLTASFWARATSGAPKVGVEGVQTWGAGGSPSASVTGIGSVPFTLSTAWARYSMTALWPSTAGKTYGTTLGTDFSVLNFWLSSGATFNSRAGGIGVQSYTLQLWGVQLENAPIASPLEKPDLALDWDHCLRFCCKLSINEEASAAGLMTTSFPFPQPMRATPTATVLVAGAGGGATGPTDIANDGSMARFQINASVSSGAWQGRTTLFSADL